MCNDMLCRQITNVYVCKCLFDAVVKIKFSLQARCHEEIVRPLMFVSDQHGHLFSVSFNSLCQRTVLCGICAVAFMIMVDGKKICFHLKAELRFDNNKISVTCCVRCLRTEISKHFYILPCIVL